MAVKAIGDTIKSPIVKTIGNTIKNSVIIFRQNKNTIKNLGCGLQEKYLRTRHNFGSKSVKYLGEEAIKTFKYIVHYAVGGGKQLVRTKGKKIIQTRSGEQMGRKGLISLLNILSKSKPQLPLLFVTESLNQLTQFNLLPSSNNIHLYSPKDIAKKAVDYEDLIKEQTSEANRRYYKNNKSYILENRKEYYIENQSKILERSRIYNLSNKDKLAEQNKKYYIENQSKILEQKKQYSLKNKEKIAENKRKYYLNNKTKIKERNKEYILKNKEKYSEKSKEYYKNNKEKLAERSILFRLKNKDKIAENSRKHYENNRDRLIEKNKAYQMKNKDKMDKYKKEYYQKNKDNIARQRRELRLKNKLNEGLKDQNKSDPKNTINTHISSQLNYINDASI